MKLLGKKFNPGGVPDRFDSRDYQWDKIAGAAGIPLFDWSKGYDVEELIAQKLGLPVFKIPTKNQGGSFSCGGQAWSYYGATLECLSDGSYEERSAKFIYSQTFYPNGGSTGRDNSNIVIKQGWAREAILGSYMEGKPPTEEFITRASDITEAIRKDASLAKALSYANVRADIDYIAQAMATNGGLVIGVGGENNNSWLSQFPQKPVKVQWWHWLYACKAKVINGRKYIGVKNSWGDAVGDGGIQWLGEDYLVDGLMLNNWTLTFYQPKPVNAFTYVFQNPISYGQRGEDVRALQTVLKNEKFLNANATGYFGDLTAEALYNFQVSYAVASQQELDALKGKNSRAGKKTIDKLNELVKQRSYISY